MVTPALVVEGLGKRFGERVAFEDVSFEIARGEVFGFLGPNGAGKTTTVRTLGTLIAPTTGSATVAGLPRGRRRARAGHARAVAQHADPSSRPGLAPVLAAVLVVANRLGWRGVSALFDRERLITGS